MTAAEIAARWLPGQAAGNAGATRISKLIIAGTRALFIIGAPIAFQLIMIAAQSFQPGYNPLRDTVSSLVWGPHGWLQTVNFILFGGMLMALVEELKPLTRDKIWPRFGGFLLFLVGIGFIILAICPIQSPGGPETIQAIIHGLTVYFIVFFFPAGCLLLAPVLRVGSLAKFIVTFTIVTGAIGLCLILLGIFIMANEAQWFGMLERVLLLNGFLWLEIIAVYFAGENFINKVVLARTM
jgi:Protein of unknown function (DUF998)